MMTSESIVSGMSPVTAADVELTEITSGGTGGVEFVRLLSLGFGGVPARIGARHVFLFKTQTNENDVVKIAVLDPPGQNAQSVGCYDSSGNLVTHIDNGEIILQYRGGFVAFEWDGGRWVLDSRPRNHDSVALPQLFYVPSTNGFPDGSTLKIVNGQPAWV